MSDKYYQAEYNYLVDAGARFAARYPDLARQLNLTDAAGRDPNVERLLEGFAFLTGRIHQRLDADYPSLVQGLLTLLWPHYGLPLPSCCLLSFSSRSGPLAEGRLVPAGATVASRPDAGGRVNQYRTASRLWVPPAALTQVQAQALGSQCRLKFTFHPSPGTDPTGLAGERIRVQLFGELSNCRALFNLLLGRDGGRRRLRSLVYEAQTERGPQTWRQGPGALIPAGLGPDELLFDRGDNSFWGFGLLEDYFLFKEKHLAFHLGGLEPLAEHQKVDQFSVELIMEAPWPSGLRVDETNFRLGCVPAVNLFAVDAEPIRVDQLRSSYPLVVDLQNPDHYQVFSVERVEGISADGARRMYRPLLAVQNRLDQSNDLSGPFYVLSRDTSATGQVEVNLALVDPSGKGRLPQAQTLSISVVASNGRHGAVPTAGQINQAGQGVPAGLAVENLTQPSAAVFPPGADQSLWSWLGHASLNYLDLSSADRLQVLLQQFEPQADQANRRRIQGIRSVTTQRTRERMGGGLAAGQVVDLELEEDHFSDAGDLQMFMLVLSAFMSGYASINSFQRLRARLNPSGATLVMGRSFGEWT